jgi:hypothetical protein
MAVELLAAGSIVVLLIVFARLGWRVRRRTRVSESVVTEAQARENAAPLTTAILEPVRRNRRHHG